MQGAGINILHWGGRGSSVMFFAAGVVALWPPPLDLKRGMLATFLVMIALIFLVVVELLGLYFAMLDPFSKETQSISLAHANEVARGMFSVLAMGTNAVTNITKATTGGGDHSGRRKH